MTETMSSIELNEKTRKASELLLQTNLIRSDVTFEILENLRMVPAECRYADMPYLPAGPDDQQKGADTLRRLLDANIRRQLEEYVDVSLSMFSCLMGDATQLTLRPELYVPNSFDDTQPFYQRTKVLTKLFSDFSEIGVPLNLSLLLGDSDILTHFEMLLQKRSIEPDLGLLAERVSRYRESIAVYLRSVFAKLGDLADVWTFGNDAVSLEDARGTGRNGIYIISLLLNTDLWGYNGLDLSCADPGDVEDCRAELLSWLADEQKFDAQLYRDCSEADIMEIVAGVFGSYRDQGRYLQAGGRIVLVDELPPQMNCRMLRAGCGDLLFLFPWIRSENILRDPKTVESQNELC
jgi:hypothetical protein